MSNILTNEEMDIILNGYTVHDKAIKMLIDNTDIPFVFHDLLPVNENCSFSCWVKGEDGNKLTFGTDVHVCDGTWQRVEITDIVNVIGRNFNMEFMDTGTYYFYRMKMEIGNKVTDYGKSQLDYWTVDQLISEISQTSSAISISIKNLTNGRFSEIEQTLDGVTIKTEQGATYINGSTIKTGVIEDLNGNFYLDMETGELVMSNGEFSGVINATGGSFGKWNINDDYIESHFYTTEMHQQEIDIYHERKICATDDLENFNTIIYGQRVAYNEDGSTYTREMTLNDGGLVFKLNGSPWTQTNPVDKIVNIGASGISFNDALRSDNQTVITPYQITTPEIIIGDSDVTTIDGNGVDTPRIKANNMDSGQTTGVTVSANHFEDIDVTFHKTFASVPNVIACFASTSTAPSFGRCTLAVHSTTTTGCKIRVYNGDTSARQPNFNWFAFDRG